MIFSLVLLLAGLLLLVFSGDFLVKGAVGIAENLGIPPLVIGLTVVAFGTSAPELFISVQAALQGKPGIAVGNAIGSNIANVLLVMGLPAIISAVTARQPGIRRNLTAMLAVTVVFVLMLYDGVLTRFEGLTLFLALCLYIWWQIHQAGRVRAPAKDYHDDIGEAPHETSRVVAYLAAGIVGLPLAAQLTVTGAGNIARAFGISEAAIGLTIIAIGTSLPELATTLMAAIRRTSAVALGNIVGSNIFNIACIMGITGMIVPVPVDARIGHIDMWVMLAVAILLAAIGFARVTVGKLGGAAMLLAYLAYIVSVF
ncbi:MAG: calcium/sodium antiporter [Rhizobiaceae bacterium]